MLLNPNSLMEIRMAWIKVIKEDEAEGELRSTYDKMIEPWGGVDNIMKIHSLNVPSLKAHNLIYGTLMRGKSDLSRVQREMIAVVASVANHCKY
jgi:alkylhydroperoxidase family enzyme